MMNLTNKEMQTLNELKETCKRMLACFSETPILFLSKDEDDLIKKIIKSNNLNVTDSQIDNLEISVNDIFNMVGIEL